LSMDTVPPAPGLQAHCSRGTWPMGTVSLANTLRLGAVTLGRLAGGSEQIYVGIIVSKIRVEVRRS
jgi:hypothetical protein